MSNDFDYEFFKDDTFWRDFYEPTEQEQAEQFRKDNQNNPVMRIKFIYQDSIDLIPLQTKEAAEVYKFFSEKILQLLKDFGEAS
jgi:hypothetical protein